MFNFKNHNFIYIIGYAKKKKNRAYHILMSDPKVQYIV